MKKQSPQASSAKKAASSKPKAKSAARAGQPRKSAAKTKSAPKKVAPAPRGARATKPGEPPAGRSASRLIDQRIRDLGGWRGRTLARMRALILAAVPEMTEEVKWRKPSNSMQGVPVWSHGGIVCTGETYAKVVKLTFAQGAKLSDPAHLFNASLTGGKRRAIDIHEGEEVDAAAFKALVQAAVQQNGAPAKKGGAKARSSAMASKPRANGAPPRKAAAGKQVVLLSGGNPQIAKGDGDAPVQAYLAAAPGWKGDVGKRLDALLVQAVPDVQKAVKWNSPFYGVAGQGWFLNFHCFTKFVRVAFFAGRSLRPVPPGESKVKDVRYLDIYEDAPLDEGQFAAWAKQAAALPGWNP